MQKILFIKREGTLINTMEDSGLDSLENLEFSPGVFQYLSRIIKELDYQIVMLTTSGAEDVQNIIGVFKNEGIIFYEIISLKEPGKLPGIYLHVSYDPENSYLISDRSTDLQLAKDSGYKAILFNKGSDLADVLKKESWEDIYHFLKDQPRIARISRKTSETDILVEINLDGTGISQISTGLGFFDHMLEQIAKHGNMDLLITVKGDLNIDEHHTIEDVGLSLGDAIFKALGNKKGTERYGFVLPMDDCLTQVAIDFGGRPWLVWEAEFKREKIGDMPTEMFIHFFKSFSDNAKCNINIKAEGTNEHHKIEAIFKCFAKTIKMAVKKTGMYNIPSTKGSL